MKFSKTLSATSTSVAVLMGTAYAAVPAAIQTSFDAAATDATDVLGIIAGAVVTLIGGMWLISMIKRGKSV